ncbi:uncharacterized protein BYT42DRAFT_347839 [Radiomyces spectabilis]|uniref:uncharacterized protein n=1 Tax=Radiomyces spectabilis TaxID=64574 RepID=UPI00221E65DB|nr:uncharacterized protein BYT42DRAFT_347839 [Radiomyces spectabilis]KAI8377546.1 hypothetical protein BYT42DRAFT_347839 [Radiomyces spectabilis]
MITHPTCCNLLEHPKRNVLVSLIHDSPGYVKMEQEEAKSKSAQPASRSSQPKGTLDALLAEIEASRSQRPSKGKSPVNSHPATSSQASKPSTSPKPSPKPSTSPAVSVSASPSTSTSTSASVSNSPANRDTANSSSKKRSADEMLSSERFNLGSGSEQKPFVVTSRRIKPRIKPCERFQEIFPDKEENNDKDKDSNVTSSSATSSKSSFDMAKVSPFGKRCAAMLARANKRPHESSELTPAHRIKVERSINPDAMSPRISVLNRTLIGKQSDVADTEFTKKGSATPPPQITASSSTSTVKTESPTSVPDATALATSSNTTSAARASAQSNVPSAKPVDKQPNKDTDSSTRSYMDLSHEESSSEVTSPAREFEKKYPNAIVFHDFLEDIPVAPDAEEELAREKDIHPRETTKPQVKDIPQDKTVLQVETAPQVKVTSNTTENKMVQTDTAKELNPTPTTENTEESMKDQSELLFSYPFQGGKNAVSIFGEDVARLREGEYLNDSIIDMYMNWLLSNGKTISKDIEESTHIFSCFFYERLTRSSNTAFEYENVKKWTSGVDLFKKKFVIVPINENCHWYTVVITDLDLCVPTRKEKLPDIIDLDAHHPEDGKPTMFLLDSLGRRPRKCFRVLTEYLQLEAKNKFGIEKKDFVTPNIVISKVPLQNNYSDCGVFLLHSIEMLLSKPEKYIEILRNHKERSDLAWNTHLVPQKRENIKKLFRSLKKQYRRQGRMR